MFYDDRMQSRKIKTTRNAYSMVHVKRERASHSKMSMSKGNKKKRNVRTSGIRVSVSTMPCGKNRMRMRMQMRMPGLLCVCCPCTGTSCRPDIDLRIRHRVHPGHDDKRRHERRERQHERARREDGVARRRDARHESDHDKDIQRDPKQGCQLHRPTSANETGTPTDKDGPSRDVRSR